MCFPGYPKPPLTLNVWSTVSVNIMEKRAQLFVDGVFYCYTGVDVPYNANMLTMNKSWIYFTVPYLQSMHTYGFTSLPAPGRIRNGLS